jgi:hypothetical protein
MATKRADKVKLSLTANSIVLVDGTIGTGYQCMKAVFVLWSVLLLVFFLPSSSTIATGTNSCQICHTHEAVLKALYKPPAMEAGEGEG